MRPSHSFFVDHHSELVPPPSSGKCRRGCRGRRIEESAVRVFLMGAVIAGGDVVVEGERAPSELAAWPQDRATRSKTWRLSAQVGKCRRALEWGQKPCSAGLQAGEPSGAMVSRLVGGVQTGKCADLRKRAFREASGRVWAAGERRQGQGGDSP